MHINPEHFLQTENGRVITPELNKLAWKRSFEALDEALQTASSGTKVYVLVGPQGAGKSTWAKSLVSEQQNAIIFDAILVKKSEREPILAAVNQRSIGAIAVWFKTSLEICITRNAARPADEIVSEEAIRNVHAAIEPPSAAEGFERVIEVSP